MIHRVDRDLRIRQTRPGIERPHSIDVECGMRWMRGVSFFFSLPLFFFSYHRSTAKRRGESAYVRGKKRRMHRTMVKRTGRHDTHNKASGGCSRFGIISDITLQKNGRDTERLLAIPRHGIKALRFGCACMRACTWTCVRACVSTRYSQLARSWRKRVTKAESERHTRISTRYTMVAFAGTWRERSRACAPLRATCASFRRIHTCARARNTHTSSTAPAWQPRKDRITLIARRILAGSQLRRLDQERNQASKSRFGGTSIHIRWPTITS